MTDYLTEQEQIELIKQWIKQYLPMVILGLILAAAIIFGWRYWQQRQLANTLQASAIYDDMLSFAGQNDDKKAVAQAETLYKNYVKTPYAQMAVLYLAKNAAANKNYTKAVVFYNWVINNSHVAPLREIARLREARVLITEKKAENAITLLHTVDDETFTPLIKEVTGDAYMALNQIENARNAYKQALAALPNAQVQRPILQIKLDNLAAETL